MKLGKQEYEKALYGIADAIGECADCSVDDNGNCVCRNYPCWRIYAEEIIANALEKIEE